MNVGQSEGSQIIQLFGRGVRLKGYGFGLKRSRKVQEELRILAPKDIDCLETLNIFGVRASYMAEFRKYLEDEGLPSSTNRVSLTLPTLKPFGSLPRLRIIAVQDGIDYKKQGPRPTLGRITGNRRPSSVSIDWYPKIESQRSTGARSNGDAVNKHEVVLSPKHLAFMDFDAILFELLRFKNEKSWYNYPTNMPHLNDLISDGDIRADQYINSVCCPMLAGHGVLFAVGAYWHPGLHRWQPFELSPYPRCATGSLAGRVGAIGAIMRPDSHGDSAPAHNLDSSGRAGSCA